jgi:alpha-2-macroglobulin
MVRFIGPFTLERNRKASHRIRVPEYTGSVRAMIVAGYEGAYGNAETTVPVKKPLMILSTLPRRLSPGERVRVPVTVFAENRGTVSVRLDAGEMFTIRVIPGNRSRLIHRVKGLSGLILMWRMQPDRSGSGLKHRAVANRRCMRPKYLLSIPILP